MNLTDQEFSEISHLVHQRLGICLPEQKRGLVSTRLSHFLAQNGFQTFQHFIQFVKNDSSGEGLRELTNRITTNHTFFFRENDHFDFFQKIALPEIVQKLKKNGSKDLRLWSAACATGEEPYTLVMLMMEFFGCEYGLWNAGVLATDISKKALDQAKQGIFSTERMTSAPKYYQKKFFVQVDSETWSLSNQVKKEVTFRTFNLLNELYPFRHPFHIIFCRNVMIYFDAETRRNLLQKLYQWLVPGGYLFIGHSESIRSINLPLKYIQPAVFQKPA